MAYTEAAPPEPLGDVVRCFWELRTDADLADDFTLHAMPDACVNLLFDQRDTSVAGVTQLHTTHITLKDPADRWSTSCASIADDRFAEDVSASATGSFVP